MKSRPGRARQRDRAAVHASVPLREHAKVIAAQPKQLAGTVTDLKLIEPPMDAAKRYKTIPATFETRSMLDPAALA